MTEHQLQTQLMHYLKFSGYYVQRLNSGMVENKYGGRIRLGDKGTPDIMAFKDIHGQLQLLFIEVKTPKNPKPTFWQEQKMAELSEHGAICLVVHSLEELEEKLA